MRSSAALLGRGAAIAVAAMLAAGCSSTVAGNASFGGPSPTPTHTPAPTPTATPSTPAGPVNGGTATVGTAEFAQNLNPYSPNGDYGATFDIEYSVLPSAFTVTGSNRYVRNTDLLTADPTVTRSHGHQVVTYSLSPDAKWSDGTPIGVEDFNFLVKQAKQNKNSFVGPDYTQVRSVAKGSDDHHVVVTFTKSDGDWRSLFSPLLPAHYLSRAGWESGFRNRVPVTAGPFKVSSVNATTATLVKDPNYFGTKAHLDKVILRSFPDPLAGLAAVNSRVADAYYIDPATTSVPSTSTDVVDGGYYTQLTFNLHNKTLKKIAVRKAIALALDRNQIARIGSPVSAHPSKVAGNNMFASGSHGGAKNDAAYAAPNVAKAKQLLRSAGFSGSKTLTLRLITSNTDAHRVAVAQVIAQELRAIGIHATVVPQVSTTFFSSTLPHHEFDLALFAWSYTSTAKGSADTFGCHSTDNYSGYCSANFDRLVGQSLDQPDLDKHNELLNKADHQMWTDLPQIPLYQSQAVLALSPKVHGATYNLGEFTLYWDLASWTKSP